jgi:hypothetical protein
VGAGGSVPADKETINKETAAELAGDQFDKAAFDAAAVVRIRPYRSSYG